MHFSCGIVRPPYEAGSCFLQVTSGCSHNKCRFCTFYKEAPFSVSPESEIREDLQEIRDSGWKVKRIFLQGADPFLLSYDRLKRIMDLIKEYLPWGVSVGGYGRVDSVKNKSVEQLKSLKEMGYDMIVFGIESGDDAVLDKMNKGYHGSDIVEQLSKLDEAGMHYSVIFLYGLGGHDYGMGHAIKTAEVLNHLSPVRVLASGLSIFPDTPLMEEVRRGEFVDSSCGTGGFLVQAMTHVISQLERQISESLGIPKEKWDNDTLRMYQDKISEMASQNYFGFDINPDLVKATKMNMVMNNDGSGNILQTNSLLPPHEWSDDFKTRLSEAVGVKKSDIKNYKTIAFFDVIVTNPPFGSKIPIKDRSILEQFELAHIWTNDKKKGTWTMTDRLQSSVPPEILFIERCTQFLVPGGRMGIVLPDSILGSPGLGYIREWLIRNHRIIASIDLNADTFQPHNGTQTSVLFLQKKTQEQKDQEEKSGEMADYDIFMAMVDKIGHDKRGNPIFKRDAEGNEILVPDTNNVLVLDETSEGTKTVSHQQTKKVEDDQTPDVPGIFAKWKIEEGLAW